MLRRALFTAAVVGSLVLGADAELATAQDVADVKELAKERKDAARDAYEFLWDEFHPYELVNGDGENVYRWSLRWMQAERDLATTQAEHVAALRAHWERMKKLEAEVHGYARGTIPFQQMVATKYFRAEAEIWLAEAMGR